MPRWADFGELDLCRDEHVVRIAAGVDQDAADRRAQAPLPLDDPRHPIVGILGGAPPRFLDIARPADAPLFGPVDDPVSATALGISTALVAPIRTNGEVVGALALGRRGRRFDLDDLDIAVDLAWTIGLAWHNAVLLADRASILASLNDGLIVTDASGAVTEVNRRWCEISGFDEQQCIGARPPYPWLPEPAPDAGPAEIVLAGGGSAVGDDHSEARIVFRRADGSTFPGLVSIATMADWSSGERRGLVASVKDLTLREAAQADLAALQRVTARLAGARNVADVTQVTLSEVVLRPSVDASFLTRLTPDGQFLDVVAADGPLSPAVVQRGRFPIDRLVPATVAVRDGTTVVVSSTDELVARFPHLRPSPLSLGIASVLATPVRLRGDVIGALSLWSTRPNAFDDRDANFVAAVAAQYAQALHRAEGYELEYRASRALQNRLLFDVPVLHQRATIATRYQPASIETGVGGDWYDVIPLGAERLAVVVGDVVGSGVDAAAVMGQLRSGLKGVALTTTDPAAVLEGLDHLAAATGGAPGATVCYAVIDYAAKEVRFARAGHPPPLLVTAGAEAGARFLDGYADPPLGLGLRRHRREAVEPLGSGDVLLLFTDGLVERRAVPLGDRLELLRASAAGGRRSSVEELVDDVIAACALDGQQQDDLAVIAVRDEPAGPARFRRLLPARARELSPLRHALRDWLQEVGVEASVVDDLVLAASEAATNAVEHAYRDVIGNDEVVSVAAAIDGDGVMVEVRDAGSWKPWPSKTTRGRGLALVRALLGSVDVRTGPSGTTVSFTYSPARTTGR